MFERKSMEQILDSMIRWTRGATTRLTDFRVGSKILTIYESVAVVVEELYDKVYRTTKQLIEENIYSVIGFDRIPATFANGKVRFGRSTPAEDNYIIPAGTTIKSRATQLRSPIKYRTTEDALLEVGKTFVDVPVVCLQPGTVGNAGAGDIIDFEVKPVGVEHVTNMSALLNGREQETKEEQKTRFQLFIQANARGVLQAVEYGASTAQLQDTDGVVAERVVQCVAIEDLENKLGQVDVHIWNGVGDASEDLKEAVRTILRGSYEADGSPVYGYKPAGIRPNIYTADVVDVWMKLAVSVEDSASEAEIRVQIEAEIDRYCARLKMGESLMQTALEANIKYIDGVHDVKLMLSTDGETFHTDNITTQRPQIIVPKKPVQYE